MADTQLDNLAGDITLWGSALEGAKIMVSDMLTPALRDFVQIGTSGLTAVTDAFKQATEAQSLAESFRDAEGAMRPLEEIAAEMTERFGQVATVASTISFADAEGNLKEVSAFADELSEKLSAMSYDEQLSVANFLGLGGAGAVDDLWEILDPVNELDWKLEKMIAAGQAAASGDMNVLQSMFPDYDREEILSWFDGSEEGAARFQAALETVDASRMTDGFSAAMDALPELINNGIAIIMEGLPKAIEIGGEVLSAVVSGIVDNLPILAEGAVQVAASFGGYLLDTAPNIAGRAGELLDFFTGAIIENVDALADTALNIIDTFAGYLADAIPTVADKLTGVVIEISNALADPNGLENLATSAMTIINAIADALIQNVPLIGDAAINLLQSIAETISNHADELSDAAINVIDAFAGFLADAIPRVAETATDVVTTLMETLSDPNALSNLTESGMAIIEGLVTGILDNLPRLADSAAQVLRNFGEYLRDNLPQIAERGLEMLESLSGSLRENAGKLIDAGLDMLLNLAQGFADSIPALIEHVPTIISNIAGVINDNAPKILATGVKIITTLAMGVIKAIPTLIANFPKIIKAIVDVWTAFNWLNLGKNAVEFIKNGINTLKTKIPEALKNIANTAKEWFKNVDWPAVGKSVLDFIKSGINALRTTVPETLKNIAHTAMEWFKGVDWHGLGKTVLDLIKNGINTLREVVPNALKSIANAAKEKFTSIDWMEVGKNILTGIWNGISSVADWVLTNVGGVVSSIMSRITGKQGFDEASPSKWGKRVGEYLSIGIAIGIKDKASEAVEAAEKMASDTYTALSKWADKTTKRESLALADQLEMWRAIQSQFDADSDQWWDARDKVLDIENKIASERAQTIKNQYNDLIRSVEYNVKRFGWSTQTQLSMYTEIRDQFERNSEEWLDADDKVFDARQKLAKEEEDALKARADAWKNYAADVQKATESVSELEANYQKELAKRAGEIANSYKLFAEVPTPKEVNGRDLLNNLQNQVKSIGRFYANIEKLAERGVNEALVAEIRAMGVGASDELNALLQLSDRQLSQYAALYEEKQSLANSIALDELSELRVETDNKIMESLQSIGDLYDEYAPKIGTSLGEGLAEGIRDGIKEAVDAAEALANAVQVKLDTLGPNGLQIAWDSAPAPAFSGDFAPAYDYAAATRTIKESYGYDNRAAYGQSPIEISIANSVRFDGRAFAYNTNRATATESKRRGSRLID